MKKSTLGTRAPDVLFAIYNLRSRHARGVRTIPETAGFTLMAMVFLSFCLAPGMVGAQDKPATVSPPRSGIPASRKVFVHSKSVLVSAAVVEDKLLKQTEFQQRGFVITRSLDNADIVIELRHDLMTKYVFTVIDVKSQTVVAGGKLSSIGGTVAEKVAKRFIKEINAVSQP